MRPEDFRELLRAVPFQPFRVFLSNGETFAVKNPEMAILGRSVVTVYVPVSQLPLPTGIQPVVLNLVHVVKIEFLPPQNPSAN
jgi:hypothetical protein